MARAPKSRDELDFDASPAAATPPWLQPAPAASPKMRPARPRSAAAGSRSRWRLAVFAAVIVVVLGGFAWFLHVRARANAGFGTVADGNIPLIRAPTGPYKIRPADPGGLQVDEAGSAVFAAGEGVDTGGRIATEQLPEEPVARPGRVRANPQPTSPNPQD